MRRLWAQHAPWEPADSYLRPWRLVERDDQIRQRLLVIFLGERDPETAVACAVFAIGQTGARSGSIDQNLLQGAFYIDGGLLHVRRGLESSQQRGRRDHAQPCLARALEYSNATRQRQTDRGIADEHLRRKRSIANFEHCATHADGVPFGSQWLNCALFVIDGPTCSNIIPAISPRLERSRF